MLAAGATPAGPAFRLVAVRVVPGVSWVVCARGTGETGAACHGGRGGDPGGPRVPSGCGSGGGPRGWRGGAGWPGDVARVGREVELVPGAWLAAEVGRVGGADWDEPGLGEDLLGRGVLAGGGRTHRAQLVPACREPTQFPDSRGRDAASGDVLRDPVAEFGRVVLDVDQIEPAQHGAVLTDEHVEGTDASVLLGQQGVVPLGEAVEELVAAVGDRGREVGRLASSKARTCGASPARGGLSPGIARPYPCRYVERAAVSARTGRGPRDRCRQPAVRNGRSLAVSVVTIGLVYNLQPKWRASFDRPAVSLDQLAAIVTHPAALRYFPDH